MLPFHTILPNHDRPDITYRVPQHPGPPNRMDVQRHKLEHAKMYLNNYEIERRLQTNTNFRHEQQMTELDLQHLEVESPLDRLRLRVSNTLFGMAKMIRPTGSVRRDIASAR